MFAVQEQVLDPSFEDDLVEQQEQDPEQDPEEQQLFASVEAQELVERGEEEQPQPILLMKYFC